MQDVAIVGGGPAGMSAALVLARACRDVVLFDAGSPRNAVSRASHNFLTREGVPPDEIRRIARAELVSTGTRLVEGEVEEIRRLPDGGFEVLAGETLVATRKVLLATGLRDRVPKIAGLDAWLGRGVHHCPYCDGWELRDRPLAVLAGHRDAAEVALGLTTWSDDVLLCLHGGRKPSAVVLERLARNGVRVQAQPVRELFGDTCLEGIRFADGSTARCAGLFVHTGQLPGSPLPARLGLPEGPNGTVRVGTNGATRIPGLYVAGDAAGARQMIVAAAASGATAATAINTALRRERCG
jgi:thioredoxin reductase